MFKPDDFRRFKNEVIAYTKKNGFDSISDYCVLTGVPVLAAYTFVMEEMEELKDKCQQRIIEIKQFYGIKD